MDNYIQIKLTFISPIFHKAFVIQESLLCCKKSTTPACIINVDDVTLLSIQSILREQQELVLERVNFYFVPVLTIRKF